MKTRTSYAGVVAVLAATSCMLASSAGARTLAAPEAIISSVTPTHAVVGQRITIHGMNLNQTTAVTFGTEPSRSVVADPNGTWVRTVVPAGVPSGPVTITLNGGAHVTGYQIDAGSVPAAANRPPNYSVGPGVHAKLVVAPRITAFSPSVGRAGSRVRVVGANLKGALWLKFGGVRASIMHASASSIVAVVPKHGRTGKITVHTRGGTGVSTGVFRVLGRGAGV